MIIYRIEPDVEDPTIRWRVPYKICGCSEHKGVTEISIEEFHDSEDSPDGLQHWCKTCMRDYIREYRNNDPKFHERYLFNVTEPRRKRKKCGDCKEEKDADEFHRNKRSSDGLATYCKPCRKDRNAETYRRKRESC